MSDRSTPYLTRDLRVAAFLVLEGYTPDVTPLGDGRTVVFEFRTTPELLTAAAAFIRGSARVDYLGYEQTRRALRDRIDDVLMHQNRGGVR